ncbi:MAG: PAS domain-containing sensor histidine kinase [Pseudomonadota bacterium]
MARSSGVLALIVLGPVLALITAYMLSDDWGRWGSSTHVRVILLLDLIYALILAGVVISRVATLWIARRKKSAGTRLHLRLAGVFAVVALVPTITVAVFATLTVGVGLENLFTERFGSVLRNSLATADGYEHEHAEVLRDKVVTMALGLNNAAANRINLSQLDNYVSEQAAARDFAQAYVFNLDKNIIARGEYSYLFNFVAPTEAQLAAAQRGEIVLIRDPDRNELRALIALERIRDSFLYVSRSVQGDVLRLLDETSETVLAYDELELQRSSVLFDYAVNYLIFALLVVLASILMGLWFAERLAKPVGRLAGAAEQVGAGDLDVRVKEERGSDEIATLSRVFNRMTGQLKGQRDALLEAKDDTERRRQFIETVLSGVTAGVIGLDQDGHIDLINEAAIEMLGVSPDDLSAQPFATLAPGFNGLLSDAQAAPNGVARGEVRQVVRGEDREFLARVTPKIPDNPGEGYVLTFDDLTALVSAQRMAAWGDVARRIAHEIKNPLTPIQLSADRLRRKFADRMGEEAAGFEQYLDVITRQAGDIRRMVDEFSKFARMPEPVLGSHDLAKLTREAVLLQQQARGNIDYRQTLPPDGAVLNLDRGLIGQVLTNLLQNGADAIESRMERDGAEAPEPAIAIDLTEGTRSWSLTISDNGVGLPEEERDRLTDPYVTTRVKGTGLGLAIVKKIVEQHGGELHLGDADSSIGLDGAQVTVKLLKPVGRGPAAEESHKPGEAA